MITDGDLAMKAAIEELMPYTVHRLCTWHLEKNAISNIKRPGFTTKLKKLMFQRYSEEGFEVA